MYNSLKIPTEKYSCIFKIAATYFMIFSADWPSFSPFADWPMISTGCEILRNMYIHTGIHVSSNNIIISIYSAYWCSYK